MNESIPDAARALLAALPTCDRCEAPAQYKTYHSYHSGWYCGEKCGEKCGDAYPLHLIRWAAPAADLRAALAAEADDPALVAAVVEAAERWRDADEWSQLADAGDDMTLAVDALRAKRGQR